MYIWYYVALHMCYSMYAHTNRVWWWCDPSFKLCLQEVYSLAQGNTFSVGAKI